MKTLKISAVSAAILLAAAGIGLGIARAEGTQSDRPESSFEDQETPGGDTSHCVYGDSRPALSFEEQEDLVRESELAAAGENRPVLSFDDQEAVQVAVLEQTGERCSYR